MTKYINRILRAINHSFAVARDEALDRFHRPSRLAIAVALTVGVSVFAEVPQKAHAVSTNTPWQKLTQSQLTAVWWQWALGIPASGNPLIDDTGAKAFNGQPYSDLLFLAGTLITTNGAGTATRSITVKHGTALFFPLVNSEWDNICNKPHLGANCFQKPPSVLGVPELRVIAAGNVAPATGLYSTLTPTDQAFSPTGPTSNLNWTRLQSPPFSYTLPRTDNVYQFLFQVEVSGTVAPAVGDGYYTFIPGTLAPGHYLLKFGGTSPIGQEAITYKLTTQ
jgi:hypothetical protein